MERLKKLFIISLIISIIVLVLVTVFTIGPDTLPILLRMEPIYLLAAVALHVCSYFIWGLRMKVMTEALGYRLGLKDATEIVIANLFAASVTPSMAGGEAVRIHMLNRNANVQVGDASAVVIGERVLDALVLLITTPFALWVLSGSLISREMDLAIIGAGLFVLLMVFLAISGLLNPAFLGWLSSLFIRGLHKVKRFDRTEHLIEFIDKELLNFHNSLWAFMKTGKQGLFLGCICTMLYWIVEFMVLPLILLGLNQPPSIMVAMSLQVFLTFIMVVPVTPGASGVAELGGAALFGILVPVSILGVVVAAWRLITYYLNLVIGGIVSVKILKDVDIFSGWNSK